MQKEITRDGLIAATTSVSIRTGMSYRDQTQFLAAIVNYLDGDISELKISRSSVQRERYKHVEDEGGSIRQTYMESMADKNLVLHFDGKLVKHIEDDCRQRVTSDRLAISVTSPELGTKDDLLLGVVPCPSGKGDDMAVYIQNVLEYYDVTENIIAVCADTTASNTGSKNGAIVILSKVFDQPFIWLLCRHHIAEIHISWCFKALSKTKTTGPSKQMYKDFQQQWHTYQPIIAAEGSKEKFKTFDEEKLEPGSGIYNLYMDAKKFVAYALEHETFPRNDYKHMVEYLAFYMNVRSDKLANFHIYQPGANHNARFMCDTLYLLALDITSPVIKFLTESQKKLVDKATFIMSVYFAPAFLKSSKAEYSVKTDFEAFGVAKIIETEWDADVGKALEKSLNHHPWYLHPKCVILALADPDLGKQTKVAMLEKLVAAPIPKKSDISAEAPTVVNVKDNNL